jgi:hypothetical protein
MKVTVPNLSIAFLFWLTACSGRPEVAVIVPNNPGKTEFLAAKEIRKYIYLRSNLLLNIVSDKAEKQYNTKIILSVDTLLSDQEFSLKTKQIGNEKSLTITGGSQQALLYGAYEFAEQLGVRFYLYGDVIPDKKISFRLPDLDIRKKPLFVIRGILPFHDFPEGPDWWNENDYKAIIAQLPKMKMNFIGFHTYPWRRDFNGEGPKAEPLVWIGKEEEINADGTVKSAYPALHFHTADSTWGYVPAHTSQFLSGASQLFETDNYGPDYMNGLSPWPHSEEENIRIFNQSGKNFSQAFGLAKMLGVKTCVGTETPLVIPEPLKKRYGIQIESEKEVKEFYRGIFNRIQKTYPIDYYWLWTPEGWTWSGVEDKVITATERDIQIAHEALKETDSPFSLATCGWVLGPPKDRTQFDRTLPEDMPFSCINRGVGYTPVEKGFSAIKTRSKWSIPWMEDDPGLLVTQLWAGRMRKDALDSWKYGCDGLFGIHWRTRIISPNVSALAKAAWECDKYEQQATGRDLPVEDFYNDWVKSEFGINDPELARIFTSIDSKGKESKEGYKGDSPLNASDWIAGPGALMTNRDPAEIQERIGRYNFLTKLEEFRNKVSGAGNLERFDYWLNALRFNKSALETALAQVELNQTVARIKEEADEGKRTEIARTEAIPERIRLSEKWQDMNKILLSFVTTDGELGTIANLEMHNILKNGNLTGNDEYLKSVLKSGLPEKSNITDKYSGNTRIIVTSTQSILQNGDDFYLRIRVLSESEQLSGKLYYRLLGTKLYSSADLKLMGSHVFEVRVPVVKIPDDFEYYIEVSDGKGKVIYPVTAGVINNAVVIL